MTKYECMYVCVFADNVYRIRRERDKTYKNITQTIA